jgi:hypothetical protein
VDAARKAKAVEMLLAGRSASAVSKEMNIHYRLVARWRAEAGLPPMDRGLRRERISAGLRRSKATGRPIGGTARSLAVREGVVAAGWPWATPAEAEVLDVLLTDGGWMSATAIHATRGLASGFNDSTRKHLIRLAGRDLVFRRRTNKCEYRIADVVAERRRAFLVAQSGRQA